MDTEAQLFKALSEPVRLRIMALLSRGERCVCDLMAVLDMPQSTVSRHLAYLKNAGLINGQRQGAWMFYRLAEPETELHAGLISLINACFPELSQSKKDLATLALHESTQGHRGC